MKWKNVEQELPIRNREIKNMCEEENEKYYTSDTVLILATNLDNQNIAWWQDWRRNRYIDFGIYEGFTLNGKFDYDIWMVGFDAITNENDENIKITHWMPLPKLPNDDLNEWKSVKQEFPICNTIADIDEEVDKEQENGEGKWRYYLSERVLIFVKEIVNDKVFEEYMEFGKFERVFVDDKFIGVERWRIGEDGYYSDEWTGDDDKKVEITHWMPLPKLPNE